MSVAEAGRGESGRRRRWSEGGETSHHHHQGGIGGQRGSQTSGEQEGEVKGGKEGQIEEEDGCVEFVQCSPMTRPRQQALHYRPPSGPAAGNVLENRQ